MAIDDSEEAIQKFLKDNPRCCEVNRYPSYRGMLDLLIGWNMPEVEINYERHPERPAWMTLRYDKAFAIVSTCGEFVKLYQSGTDTDSLETTRYTRHSK